MFYELQTYYNSIVAYFWGVDLGVLPETKKKLIISYYLEYMEIFIYFTFDCLKSSLPHPSDPGTDNELRPILMYFAILDIQNTFGPLPKNY